jgi:DNA repair protein RecO (recombination protein O)
MRTTLAQNDGPRTMASEKATALVLRTTDWSETSRIATLWTREFGKVRVLAKGGRRLRSNFESALDLLGVCSIVFLRKSSGGLDLLTEAQLTQRFPLLRTDLRALYGAYYLAELLADWTEDYDAHPPLFEHALATLGELGAPGIDPGLRVMRFEMQLLRELGYSPVLDGCVHCGGPIAEDRVAFSCASGGLLCALCQREQRQRRPLTPGALRLLRGLETMEGLDGAEASVRAEVRQLLGEYVTWLRGRPPRLLPYLERGS